MYRELITPNSNTYITTAARVWKFQTLEENLFSSHTLTTIRKNCLFWLLTPPRRTPPLIHLIHSPVHKNESIAEAPGAIDCVSECEEIGSNFAEQSRASKWWNIHWCFYNQNRKGGVLGVGKTSAAHLIDHTINTTPLTSFSCKRKRWQFKAASVRTDTGIDDY